MGARVDEKKFAKGKIVQGLYSCEELPGRIAALSTTGDVEVIDIESLETKSSMPSSNSSTNTHAWLFSASTASLSRANSGATLVALSSGTSKTIHLRILAIDEADSISEEHEWEIPIDAEVLAVLINFNV
jgi:gephyrin